MPKVEPMFSFLTILILCNCFPVGIRAQNSPLCVGSSCGGVSISYPFRLAADPAKCGHPAPIFNLQCLQNRTILQSNSAKYLVRSISYNNYSIRVSDLGVVEQNLSTCPAYSSNSLGTTYMWPDGSNTDIILVNCPKSVSHLSYVEDPVCGNRTASSSSSRVYSYFVVGWVSESEKPGSCTEVRRTLVSSDSLRGNSTNYTTIHDSMAYGMQLTWYNAMCGECDRSNGRCSLEGDKIRCRHYCYEDTPFSERTFGCKLEYYGVLIFVVGVGIASLLGLRFILGVVFVIGFLLYKRRKQRSSTEKSGAIERGSDPESSTLELERR